MPYTWARNVLVGRNPAVSARFAAVAAGSFIVVFGGIMVGEITGMLVDAVWTAVETIRNTTGVDEASVVAFVLVGFAAANAYHNDGLLVSWVLVFAPLFAAFLTGFMGTLGVEVTAVEFIGAAAGFALLFAGILGTAGFLLGAVSRRAVDGFRARNRSDRPN